MNFTLAGNKVITPMPILREPYITISTVVYEYTGELVSQGESQYSAHEKIMRCLKEMDELIVGLTTPTPGNLLHPNEKVRNIAKEKYDRQDEKR